MYLSEKNIGDALAAHFRGNGNIVLRQVRNRTGFSGSVRTADMLIVSTWPSRGMYAEGVEIKSSKGDLKRELATPDKAEEIAQYCSRWWIATSTGLSDGLDIPQGWGLLEVDEKLKVKVSRQGKPKDATPFDTHFACTVMRSFAESMVSCDELEQRIQVEVAKRIDERKSRANSDLANLKSAVATWKELTGIDLLTDYGRVKWDLKADAHAFNLVRSLHYSPSETMVKAMAEMETAIAAVRSAMKGGICTRGETFSQAIGSDSSK